MVTPSIPNSSKAATRISLVILMWMSLSVAVHPGGRQSEFSYNWKAACQWGAVTTILVTAPVIGASARAGAERILATIVGGWVAYGLFMLCRNDIFLAGMAGVIAFMGHIIGEELGFKYGAGKLLVVTFIVVVMAFTYTPAIYAAVSRVIGICCGVVVYQIAAIFIFPSAASDKTIEDLRAAMQAMMNLLEVCWNEDLHGDARPHTAVSVNGSQPDKDDPDAAQKSSWLHNLRSSSSRLLRWKSGDLDVKNKKNLVLDAMLKHMLVMVEELNSFKVHLEASKNELYLGCCLGVRWYAPMLPGMHMLLEHYFQCKTATLPRKQLRDLENSLRDLKCTVRSMGLASAQGIDGHACKVIKSNYSHDLLVALRTTSLEAMQAALDRFTLNKPAAWLLSDSLEPYQKAADELLTISARKRLQSCRMRNIPEQARGMARDPGDSSLAADSSQMIRAGLRAGVWQEEGKEAAKAGADQQRAKNHMRLSVKLTPSSRQRSLDILAAPLSDRQPSNLLFTPDNRGFLTMVRWNSFHFEVAELAVDMKNMYSSINCILPYLPSSQLRGSPPLEEVGSDVLKDFDVISPPMAAKAPKSRATPSLDGE